MSHIDTDLRQKMAMSPFLLEILLNVGLLLTCLTCPIIQLRPVAAIIFAIHWSIFIVGRILPHKHFRSETQTSLAVILSYGTCSVYSLLSLGHQTLDLSNKYQLATTLLLAYVIYLAGSERPGRVFPFFKRGESTSRRLLTWTGQAIRVFVNGTPLWIQLAYSSSKIDATNKNEQALLYVGIFISFLGMYIVRSAHQSRPLISSLHAIAGGRSVNARPEQLLTTMRSGLWRYSRHPDFFGECLIWSGVVIMFHSLNSYDDATTKGMHIFQWLPLSSPIFSFVAHYMFTIPSIEKDEYLRFNHLPAYKSYVSMTSTFFPLPLSTNNEIVLASNIDADAQEFSQPTNRGAYKSSRADTITEALQASKAAKLLENKSRIKKRNKNRNKTPQGVRHRGKRVAVQ